MRRNLAIVLLLACAPCLGSCAAWRTISAAPDDYQRYRAVRLQTSFLGRLSAAWSYLEAEPDGVFRPEVERWFERADERFLVRHWDDVSNLKRYLGTMPEAPRAGIARARVDALLALKARVAREEAEFLGREAKRQRALNEAKHKRGVFVTTAMGWVEAISTSTDFGIPPERWSSHFRRAYFEQPPVPKCDEAACEKTMLLDFDIPRHQGLETRAVTFTLRADLRDGKLHTMELAGANLFDRLAEAATARAADPGDMQAHAEAIGVSAQLLSMAVSVGFSDPACERDAISPTILERACGGKSVRAIAAEDEAQVDRVIVRPSE